MEPKIVTKEEFKVLGMQITCPGSMLHIEMPRLWKTFTERAGEIKNRTRDYMIDICLQEIGDEFTQLICVEVSDINNIPKGMTGLTIPEQKYAYFKHEGPVEDIWKSFGMLQKWVKENGHTRDPLDFKMDYCPDNPELPHELYQKII